MPGDGIKSRLTAQRVAVSHCPKFADGHSHGTAQGGAKVGEPIELPPRCLALAALDGGEVIAVDGRRAGGDGAGRPLRGIALISGHAIFRRNVRRHHLQQIDL
jgi:hypothetical protein